MMIDKFNSLIVKELKQRRIAVAAYSLISFAFLWMYVAIFPSFQAESQKFNELIESYPKAILEAFNLDQLRLDTLEGYLAAEHFSFVWPMMAILLMLSFAGWAIAGEIEKGTISIMLSLPVNRRKIYIQKYLSGLIILIIFSVFSVLAAKPIAILSGIDLDMNNLMITFMVCLLFGWTILSAGFAVSSYVKEKSSVYFVMGGLLLAMYVLNIVSGLVSSLEWLKYGSVFYYFQPSNIIMTGVVNRASILTMLIAVILLSYLGLRRFVSRDISV